jgi:hypothetical protein
MLSVQEEVAMRFKPTFVALIALLICGLGIASMAPAPIVAFAADESGEPSEDAKDAAADDATDAAADDAKDAAAEKAAGDGGGTGGGGGDGDGGGPGRK